MEKESRWSIGYNECYEKDLFENETKRRDNVQLTARLATGSQPEMRYKCKNVNIKLMPQMVYK